MVDTTVNYRNYTNCRKVLRRDEQTGEIKYYISIKDAAKNNDVTHTAMHDLIHNGKLLYNRYHFSCDNNWCHCVDEQYIKKGKRKEKPETVQSTDIDERIKQLFGPKQKTETPKVEEPKTDEDWEAMRKRALQPFVCSLTDDNLKRHEEEVRNRAIKMNKGRKPNAVDLKRANNMPGVSFAININND